MEIVSFIRDNTRKGQGRGAFHLSDLIRTAEKRQESGIGVTETGGVTISVLFFHGEPDGAVAIDDKGTLFGDKAVILLKGNEVFEFFPVAPEEIEQAILGCRIFQKGHIKKTMMPNIPQIARRAEGVGQLIITVTEEGRPLPGIHVSLRRRGQVLGSDVTTTEGMAYFKVLFGTYDCAILDREHRIRTYKFEFSRSGSVCRIDLAG